MSADRDELLRLVRVMPEDHVPQALADVRRQLRPVEERSWPPAWFGISDGDGTAVGANSEDLLDEGFGRGA